MINKQNNEKENVMTNTIVRVEKSGNRFNAFDRQWCQVYFPNYNWCS